MKATPKGIRKPGQPEHNSIVPGFNIQISHIKWKFSNTTGMATITIL